MEYAYPEDGVVPSAWACEYTLAFGVQTTARVTASGRAYSVVWISAPLAYRAGNIPRRPLECTHRLWRSKGAERTSMGDKHPLLYSSALVCACLYSASYRREQAQRRMTEQQATDRQASKQLVRVRADQESTTLPVVVHSDRPNDWQSRITLTLYRRV